MVNLRIAESHSRLQDASYERAGTAFYNVTRWSAENSIAEVGAIVDDLHKGDLVVIDGRPSAREYETGKGEKRTAAEATAPTSPSRSAARPSLSTALPGPTAMPSSPSGNYEEPLF